MSFEMIIAFGAWVWGPVPMDWKNSAQSGHVH